MRDKLIFYTFWTFALGAVFLGGFIVLEHIVDWFSAALKHILGG